MKTIVKLLQYFSIPSMVNRTLVGEVGTLSQLFSVLMFYVYHSGVFITFLNLESDRVYFTRFEYADVICFFIGVMSFFFLSNKRGVKNLVGLIVNSFIPCYFWSWIIFAVYTLITVPISIYFEQNLYGDPSPYLKGIGFLIIQLLPFGFLLYYTNRSTKK